ncbi:hypothetical protein CA265_08285 [Sphingobacteriaceae bacterium GW460-11-11-14-LB5]|nr:hypothetical protein CA265_08285 [Sphingobacteriaceae bacterium GW460-11-11-14-LB5]
MYRDKKLNQLNDALALLIPLPNNIITFLDRAEIDYSMIDFMGGSLAIWNSALRYAHSNNQVDQLVDTVLQSFPENPYLLAYKEERFQDYNTGPDINSIPWKKKLDENVLEKIMGATSSLLPIKFLEQGLIAAKAVARIEISYTTHSELGSGFLIDNNLLVTNHHVIADKDTARLANVAFNYEETLNGNAMEAKLFKLNPDDYFKTSKEDDWTVIGIDGDANTQFGKLKLKNGMSVKGDFVNIIQHPGGRYKQIALYNNIVTYADENIIQYLTDTEPGSSGAPVFNSQWEVVGLHHSGGILVEPGVPQKMLRNEGIAISKVISGLKI